jgi:hypothetical protein
VQMFNDWLFKLLQTLWPSIFLYWNCYKRAHVFFDRFVGANCRIESGTLDCFLISLVLLTFYIFTFVTIWWVHELLIIFLHALMHDYVGWSCLLCSVSFFSIHENKISTVLLEGDNWGGIKWTSDLHLFIKEGAFICTEIVVYCQCAFGIDHYCFCK